MKENSKLEVIRHDDFDFRLSADEYVAIHEEFIKAGLVETAVLQFTQYGNISNYDPLLIKYMNESPNWDFAIHGWAHTEYDGMDYNYIVRDLAACKHMTQELFGKTPLVWYPPWNRLSNTMERAAQYMDLTISNESYDIARFIREVESQDYKGRTFYFHGWKSDEVIQLPRAIELAKTVWHEPSTL